MLDPSSAPAMKVLQATAWYPPRHMGGTEMYVAGLVSGLRARGVDARVATPVEEGRTVDYDFDGVPVRTYPVDAEPRPGELAGCAPHAGFDAFVRLLKEERPDIYHQHSWTRGLGAFHLKAAHDLGVPTVLTVHTPNTNCLSGTMMRFGAQPCDGRILTQRCAACWSTSRGAPRILAEAVSRAPDGWARFAARGAKPGRLTTALSARALARRRRREFDEMLANADRIVAVAQWLRQTLIDNGAPEDRVLLSRQGVEVALQQALRSHPLTPAPGPLRLGYLGRWHPTKGVDILIRAVRALPADIQVRLVIRGVSAGEEERVYEQAQRSLIGNEPRISIEPAVSREAVADVLRELDALAVPSQWLETGPLVVLEARAAGLPVLGSAIGGIAELVQCGPYDRLLPPFEVVSWSRAIAELARDVEQVRAARAPAMVRDMSEATADMADLYRSLV